MMKFDYKKYYLLLLSITIIWLLLGENYHSNFAPLILCCFGFPVYVFLYFKHLGAFSDKLKMKDPILFKKYCVQMGYFKDEMIHSMNLFNNSDFENLKEEEELVQHYKLTRSAIKYLALVFISFPILTIFLILIK